MKLKFKSQDFQTQAVNAVVDLFTSQEKTKSTFSVVDERQTSLLPEMGQGNALYINQETLTANMHTVQNLMMHLLQCKTDVLSKSNDFLAILVVEQLPKKCILMLRVLLA